MHACMHAVYALREVIRDVNCMSLSPGQQKDLHEHMHAGDRGSGKSPSARQHRDMVAGKRCGAAAPLEHAVSVWSETDIFHAVGLSYVPAHMRHFHNVSF